MNSTLIDVTGKLPTGMVSIYREVFDAAGELQLEALVVGAMARDLVLVHGFGAKLERGTRDVDFAVQVKDWEAFQELAAGLIEKGFTKADKLAHRFYMNDDDGLRWEVDIVPFGELADENGCIKWPPDESIEMSVLGFNEAFEHSLAVQLGDSDNQFSIKVAAPASMAFLKLISWLEREPAIRTKDAKDIRYLMRTYSKIPAVFDRMYDEGDMEAQEWDEQRASASILGRDAASQLNQEVFDYLNDSLFSKPEKLDLLFNEMTYVLQVHGYKESELKVFIDSVIENNIPVQAIGPSI
ncbi:MAG: nucleotidyl transferase AbiEii/AbiGii toxin family protein [Gammaproteobacteria bacterium]|nr:nucleotidyl transferase AbiEii/AbiGii toxin family protein [Gammaproteobacteria bacterium]